MNKARHPRLSEPVHYVSHGSPDGTYSSRCRAAIVTDTNQGPDGRLTTLFIMNPRGLFFNDCPHDEDRKPGTFHFEH
jgi:hypothetical protein